MMNKQLYIIVWRERSNINNLILKKGQTMCVISNNEKEKLRELIPKPDFTNRFKNGNISSVAKAEHSARCSKEYLTHIKGLAVAKEALCRAKARYENLRGLAEARRTQESSARFIRDKV